MWNYNVFISHSHIPSTLIWTPQEEFSTQQPDLWPIATQINSHKEEGSYLEHHCKAKTSSTHLYHRDVKYTMVDGGKDDPDVSRVELGLGTLVICNIMEKKGEKDVCITSWVMNAHFDSLSSLREQAGRSFSMSTNFKGQPST